MADEVTETIENPGQQPEEAPAAEIHTEPSAAEEPTPVLQSRNRRKERIAKVVSDKMQKTVIVELVRQTRHTKYKKYFRKTTKFVAHNQNDDAKIGDTVRIMETRPLSKTKRWRVVEVIERAK